MRDNWAPVGYVAAAVIAALAGTAPAVANERSALLTAQGIVLLDEGKAVEAVKVFAEALTADPTDEDARYYLAYSRILSGDYAAALDALSRSSFAYWDADYLRGVAHMNLQDAKQASQAFRASIQKYRNPRSSFYAGLLYHRAGQEEQARKVFESIRDLDPDLEPYRLFYLGLIASEAGDQAVAEARWREVRERHAGTPAADLAVEMLGETTTKREGGARFLFSAQILEQYDTNPGLIQADSDLARVYHPDLTDSAGALRSGVNLAIGLGFGAKEGFGGQLGLAAYGSLHHLNPDATRFNVLQPGVFAELWYGAKRWRIALPLRFNSTFLGTEIARYSNTLGTGLVASVGLNRKLGLRTGVLAEAQNYGTNAARNGIDIAVPAELYAKVHDQVRVRGGYTLNRYATDDPASEWSFLGHRIAVGIDVVAADRLTLFGQGAFYLRGYDNPFNVPSSGPEERTDSEISVGGGARYDLTDALAVQLAWDGTFQSSIDLFTYNRDIATLALSYSY